MQRPITIDGRWQGVPLGVHRIAKLCPSLRPCTRSRIGHVTKALPTVAAIPTSEQTRRLDNGPVQAQQQPDFTNVTRHNFSAMLPIMSKAIADATFVAIDTEFTGLFPDGMADDLYDTYEERYKRLQACASSFIICQFGLTAFKWHAAGGPGGGGHWEARAFNAYIFPQPDDTAGLDKRFSCQASSLAYLASQGFDFNKMVRDGIGYLPLSAVDSKVGSLRQQEENQQRVMECRYPIEQQHVDEWRAALDQWLRGDEPELRLPLPPTRRLRTLQRLWVQASQLPSLGLGPFSMTEELSPLVISAGSSGSSGGGWHGGGPSQVVDSGDGSGAGSNGADRVVGGEADADGELAEAALGVEADEEALGGEADEDVDGGADGGVSDGEGDDQGGSAAADGNGGRGDGRGRSSHTMRDGFLVLRRLDKWRARSLVGSAMQLTARQQLELLGEQSGFAQVLAVLRDARRPVVAHNGSFDLAYSLAQFCEPLPRSWPEYKALVQRAFPGGLYDTKYLAAQLASAHSLPLGDTSLGALYGTLTDEQWLRRHVVATDFTAGGGGRRGVPEIQLAPEFRGYAGATPEDKAHEAGFDALMTGSVFARLLHIAETRAANRAAAVSGGVSGGSISSSGQSDDALLRPLEPYRGRLFMMRSDLPYADLYGTDPVPVRPAMLHVSGLTPNTRHSFVLQRFQSLGLGQVSVTMLRGRTGGVQGAYVQLQRADLVQTAIQAARTRFPNLQVTTFAEYYSRREGARPPTQPRQQQQQQQQRGGQAEAAPARPAPKVIGPEAAGGRPSTAERAERRDSRRPAQEGQPRDGASVPPASNDMRRTGAAAAADYGRRLAATERARMSEFVQQMIVDHAGRASATGAAAAAGGREAVASDAGATRAAAATSAPSASEGSAQEAAEAAPESRKSVQDAVASDGASGQDGSGDRALGRVIDAQTALAIAAKRLKALEERERKEHGEREVPSRSALQRPAPPQRNL